MADRKSFRLRWTGFLFGLFFALENEDDIRNVVDFQQTTRRYVTQHTTPYNHGCEKLKSRIETDYSAIRCNSKYLSNFVASDEEEIVSEDEDIVIPVLK
jgi:hypothetical protein